MEPISGGAAKLKPWHIVVIVASCAVAIASVPFVQMLVTKQKHEDATAAVLAGAAANTGEAWHPIDDTPKRDPAVQLIASRPPPPAEVPNPLISQQQSVKLPGAGSTAPSDQRMFGTPQAAPPPQPGAAAEPGGPITRASAAAAPDSLGAMLKPTETTGYVATRIARPWATIEAGRVIACNSVTAMTSQMAGFVKAKVTYDVKSVDGTVTLIDRNSTVDGEIAHGLVAGQDRIFVLWHKITTPAPDFVQITVNSPAADELGEAGLLGQVDHHTWQRIGGALLLSGVDIGLQGLSAGLSSYIQGGNRNNGGGGGGGSNLNFYQFQGQGQSLAGDLLKNTVNIPDTATRDQATPCSIFLSGDLDFSSVYSLRRHR